MRRVIHAKLTPPNVQGHVIERPRVEAQLAQLLASRRVVWVCATAGAGKTTAVVRAAARDPRELRWLTVDATDRAPGRLLTYLEAALAARPGAGESLVEQLLDERLPHAEVAGMLAETLMDKPVVVVLDELEHLVDGDAALAVIGSFVRYAPEGVTVVLVSREEIDMQAGNGDRRPCRRGRARVHPIGGRDGSERRGPRRCRRRVGPRGDRRLGGRRDVRGVAIRRPRARKRR